MNAAHCFHLLCVLYKWRKPAEGMEGVVRSVKVEGWGVLVSYVKQMRFLCYSVACCMSAEGAISQMWFYIELPVPVAVM